MQIFIILLATCKAVSDKLGVAADNLFLSSFNDILFERFPQLNVMERYAVTIKSHKTYEWIMVLVNIYPFITFKRDA